jgi:hypothetical protein
VKSGFLSGGRVALRIAGAVATLAGIVLAAQALQAWRDSGWAGVGAWERFWLGLSPVWLYLFFRHYSVFRKDCRACLEEAPRRDPPAP